MTVSIQEVERARKVALKNCSNATVLSKMHDLWLKSYKTEWFSDTEAAFIAAVTNGVYNNAHGANGC